MKIPLTQGDFCLYSSVDTPKKEKFILILSCSGGAGHLRAAEALHASAPLTGLPLQTETHDVLDFTSPLFKRLYSESYLAAVDRIPDLWGYFYARSEFARYEKKGLVKLFDRLNYRRYLRALERLQPDAIVCTHFLPFISISNQARAKNLPPVYAVTTDFDAHSLWVDPLVRRYFVFAEESKWQLQSKGVSGEHITVAGIPVMPEFSRRVNVRLARMNLALAPGAFTILILSGGFGTGRVDEIVQTVLSTTEAIPKRAFNIVVVCGKNRAAMQRVTHLKTPSRIALRVLGFVNNIHELMDAANVLVSKSGGLTSAEALAKRLPMLIVDPIPGQESRNADMIVEHGAGWRAINLPNLAFKLRTVIDNGAMLRAAHNAAAQLSRPHAAEQILKFVYRDISRGIHS